MSFEDRAAVTIQRILTKYGKLGRVTIRRDSTGVEDPVAGEITGAVPVDTPLLSAISPLNESLIDGKRILETDIAFLCNDAFEPKMSDIAIINTKRYSIQNIDKVDSSGIILFYEVVCRG